MHQWKNELLYSLGCIRKQFFGKWIESNIPKGGEKFKNSEFKKIVFIRENPLRKVLSTIHKYKLNYFPNQYLSARQLFSQNAFLHCGFVRCILGQNLKNFSRVSCHSFLPGLPSTERAHVALLFHKNSKDRLVPETEPGVTVEDFQ